MKPEEVPGDLVDDAVDVWHDTAGTMLLDDQMRAIIARVACGWEQRSAEAERRIDAAVAHHPRDTTNPAGPWCPTCQVRYPCPTVLDLVGETSRVDPKALARMLEGAEERRQEMLRNPPKPTRPQDLMARLGMACVAPEDLAQLLGWFVRDDEPIKVVEEATLDRLFAALKLVTDAQGDDRG